MRVTFLGTGTAESFDRAQSSILFEKEFSEGVRRILVDAGNGCLLRLGQLNLKAKDVEAVLLTHIHLDHSGDLLPLLKARWLSGVEEELKIYGPPGTSSWLESQLEAYPFLRGKLSYSIFEVSGEEKFQVSGFSVESAVTKHSVESRGYVIDGVFVTGDTSPFRELYERDFDIIIHELSLPEGFSENHTTPDSIMQFSDILREKEVYFTHMYSHTLAVKDRIAEKVGFGKFAEDLMRFEF